MQPERTGGLRCSLLCTARLLLPVGQDVLPETTIAKSSAFGPMIPMLVRFRAVLPVFAIVTDCMPAAAPDHSVSKRQRRWRNGRHRRRRRRSAG